MHNYIEIYLNPHQFLHPHITHTMATIKSAVLARAVHEAVLTDHFQSGCQLHLDAKHFREMDWSTAAAIKATNPRSLVASLQSRLTKVVEGGSSSPSAAAGGLERDLIGRNPGFDPVFMKV